MIIPTIHNNGTSGSILLQQVLDSKHALQEAVKALCQAAPNGRDYYPQGPDAFRQAQAEHISRYNRLVGVEAELEALAIAISDLS